MGITMNQRTIKVTLYQGDDLDRLGELRVAADKAKPSAGSTGVEEGEYAAAEQAYTDFHAEAKVRAVEIEMTPLGRKQWQQKVLEHPPRDDHDNDQAAGVNESTFAEALLMASITGPVMSETERMAFLDSLTVGQFDLLYQEAFGANRTIFAPKAPLLGSAPSPSSDETPDSPDASD